MDIKLEVVEPKAGASILAPEKAPGIVGNERDNLLCGRCLVTLGRRISVAIMTRRFAAPVQLLIKCPKCGVHNEVPVQLGH
jgi:hypothetical protein